jgi:hypothetical protein
MEERVAVTAESSAFSLTGAFYVGKQSCIAAIGDHASESVNLERLEAEALPISRVSLSQT